VWFRKARSTPGGQLASASVQWGAYDLYDPRVAAPLHTLPRREARLAYNTLMREKPERIDMLHRLLAANGIAFDETDAGIQALNDWFAANIEPSEDTPGRPAPVWFSVISDIALFLGEVIGIRSPGVHWEFCTSGGKHFVYYQQAVLVGFSRYPRWQLGVESIIAGYGHRLVQARGSIPHYGMVTVRGMAIDVDRLTALAHMPPDEPDYFLKCLKVWIHGVANTSA
jgi:hypothetical protein